MTIIVTPVASASARDYAWLLSAMKQRSGNRTDLDALLPDFVVLAEKRLNAEMNCRHQDVLADLTTVAGTETLDLPTDTAEIRSLTISGAGPLAYMPIDQFRAQFSSGAAGQPTHYTVIDSKLHFGPTPSNAYTVSMAYRGNLPPLVDSAGTNWLIEKFPNLYLAAAMCELCIQTQNTPMQTMWEQKYAMALEPVNKPNWATADALVMRVAR